MTHSARVAGDDKVSTACPQVATNRSRASTFGGNPALIVSPTCAPHSSSACRIASFSRASLEPKW
ncbi:hypothetical protein [Kribbella sp. NPDC023855]|uniref:hypothetical protein n=1 Tax=Kribbella sp. NPDC023855 TaxID=3154698 RepID=UPI0033DEE2BB